MSNGHPGYLALLDEMKALHEKKAHDYGTDGDPLANLRTSAEIGIEPWKAAWLRAKDKVQRINSFCLKGNLKNESLEDSLLDLAAYSLLALTLRREQLEKDKPKRSPLESFTISSKSGAIPMNSCCGGQASDD